MFTGLIEKRGLLKETTQLEQGIRAHIEAVLPTDVKDGQSISVNGVCLTAHQIEKNSFCVDISPETLERTALKTYSEGRLLNLELPVQPQTYLGGHFVLGHIDGIGHIQEIEMLNDFWKVRVNYPEELRPLLVEKGSITVDGISLTINHLELSATFQLMLIPQTLKHTTFSNLLTGDLVNLEVDILGKYVLQALRLMKEKK